MLATLPLELVVEIVLESMDEVVEEDVPVAETGLSVHELELEDDMRDIVDSPVSCGDCLTSTLTRSVISLVCPFLSRPGRQASQAAEYSPTTLPPAA